MPGYSKNVKRLMREWLAKAHERELRRELERLDENMAQWRSGAIGSGEMSYRIHEWEQGPSRALFRQYNDDSEEATLAYAIVLGVLDERELPPELLEAVGTWVAFYRSLQERDQLRDREGEWWKSQGPTRPSRGDSGETTPSRWGSSCS